MCVFLNFVSSCLNFACGEGKPEFEANLNVCLRLIFLAMIVMHI